MYLHKFRDIELGFLEHLRLANVHVLERIDGVARLFDFLSNRSGDELSEELTKLTGSSSLHDLSHLGTDLSLLGSLSVRSLLKLRSTSLGESDTEETKHVSVGGLAVYPALDESGPLLDKRAKLILREGHSVEVGETRVSGNLLNAKLDLSEKEILVVVQIGERDLDDTSLQTVGRRLETSSTVDNGLSEVTLGENSRCLQGVPVLSRHGVDAVFDS